MSVPAQIPISGPYIANGSTTQFAYTFYLLFATDLQVYVGGELQQLNNAYTVTGVGNSQGGNVIFITAPANGLEVLIKRATPYTRQTDYADNGDLLADVVNDDFDRIWLALQEINANFSSSISKAVGGNWDAQSLRITNLLDGTQPQDAATLKQLNTVNGSAGQSAAAAADSAAAAATSETNAATSQQAAANSASAASASASNSSDSATLAQKWAANPVGTEVVTGKFSSLHYASKASDNATAAANSASAASGSASNASSSASAASQSATSAKADADRAQSANPDNQLKKANNLSDVADTAQARANIGVSYGNTAGTVAQGNDSRLNTVDAKSGGTISTGVQVKGLMEAAVTLTNSATNQYNNAPAVRSMGLGRGGTNDPRGSYMQFYYQEQVNVRQQGIINLNGFGKDLNWFLRDDGQMWGPTGRIDGAGCDVRIKKRYYPGGRWCREPH
ncbi:phage tail fiber domain-containing protein [Pantoea dispersa]|uniref:phage tail fiber domain-containing protein n=1 Tax=Pantoea dispersa TaxID=59814 RepID=UPI00285B3027|nr:phage tail fiber protein [Pantoea dispersa]MDR6297776.1 hypothetical protein [Pantoea dispersa]